MAGVVSSRITVLCRFSEIRTIPTKSSLLGFENRASFLHSKKSPRKFGVRRRLEAAGIAEVEPDLNEDGVDIWATYGVSAEDFKYGIYDGHHTYSEGEDQRGTFWEGVQKDYADAEPPSGFQGLISWLFLPTIVAGLAFKVPGEYLYIGAAIFVAVFYGIEMTKPDKPYNFEPEIYNMDLQERDKLIAEYNTMDIWDFNEKYGDLWDFTVVRETPLTK